MFVFSKQASLDLYSRILDVVERNEYDNFRKRAYTTKFEKLSILPASWLGVQEAAKEAAERTSQLRSQKT